MSQKFKSIWPCPVYVATFADGTTQRMSFASPAGKPLAFERGRKLLTICCGESMPANLRTSTTYRRAQATLIDGHVEHDGKRLEDPQFALHNVVALPKRESAQVTKILATLAKAFAVEPDELRRFLEQAA